jgi:Type VI secretion system/phage-baseplate injector OB domain
MTELDTRATLQRYYGKYRATCVNNVDPMMIGRIQVIVPDVSSVVPSSWAMPCFPVSGTQNGVFTVPAIGAGVWVEFEQGNPDYPIWVGGYYSQADVPAMARAVPPGLSGFTFQTTLQNGITISDTPGPTGGILIKTTTGAMISVSDVGIVISNGKGAAITLMGPVVDVNAGALTVV